MDNPFLDERVPIFGLQTWWLMGIFLSSHKLILLFTELLQERENIHNHLPVLLVDGLCSFKAGTQKAT